MAPGCESPTCPLRYRAHHITDPGCEDYAEEMRRRGGDSGEQAARALLLMALGAGWNVEQVCDRDRGDRLTITAPDGFVFRVESLTQLYLSSVRPSLTVDRLGGTYSVTVKPWRWYQRPRWAWRVAYFLLYEPRPWDVVNRNPRP